MKLVSHRDRVKKISNLSFCEKFEISLNRVRLDGKKGITKSEFAKYIGVDNSLISRELRHPNTSSSRVNKEMQNIIDLVFD